MKQIAILFIASLLFFSCKKNNNDTHQVKFVVTGTNVTQFKYYIGSTFSDVVVPFTGTRDITIAVAKGTKLVLEAKASSNNLSGEIFVNNVLLSKGTDGDTDGDGKSEVKIDYQLPY